MLDTTDTDPHSEPPREKKTAPRRLPLRFSLGTLFLLVTLVALLTALWKTAREAWQLRDEVRKLRQECGYLTISEPNKMHAIRVPRLGTKRWAWRIYLPEKRAFRFNCSTHRIPSSGVDAPAISTTTMNTNSREFVLEAGLEKNREGQWRLLVSGSGTYFDTTIDWMARDAGWTADGVMEGPTVSVEPGQPLVLMRARVMEVRNENGTVTRVPPVQPADGLMIWIEEVPSLTSP